MKEMYDLLLACVFSHLLRALRKYRYDHKKIVSEFSIRRSIKKEKLEIDRISIYFLVVFSNVSIGVHQGRQFFFDIII
jgi:hypothetical protein